MLILICLWFFLFFCQDRVWVRPVIIAVREPILSSQLQSYFQKLRPVGFILFKEAIESEKQLTVLIKDIKALYSDYQPIFSIDEEGGKVSRLSHLGDSYVFRSQAYYGQIAEQESLQQAEILFQEDSIKQGMLLKKFGIDMNFSPVGDVRYDVKTSVIGTRSFGSSFQNIVRLCQVRRKALLYAGLIPVLKHVPGHGRAQVDSHHNLPIVRASFEDLSQTDFEVYRQLCSFFDAVMVAHVVYPCLDSKGLPSTLSSNSLNWIRKEFHYDGLFISDAIEMGALRQYGSIVKRIQLALQAGIDIVIYGQSDLVIWDEIIQEIPLQKASRYWKILKLFD